MKKYTLFLLFLIAILSFRCGKICGCTPPTMLGITALNNGNPWYSITIDTLKNDTIKIYGKTENDILKLKFFRYEDINGLHETKYYQAIYYVITGPHGALTYALDNAAANSVNINYAVYQAPYLSGNFNLTFKLATPTGNAVFDSTRVNFLNGNMNIGLHY